MITAKKVERFIKKHYNGLTDEECINTARYTSEWFKHNILLIHIPDDHILSIAVDIAIDELNYSATGPHGLGPPYDYKEESYYSRAR